MKKTIILLTFFLAYASFAQQGSVVSAPASATVDSIVTLDATGKRLRHVAFTVLQTKLKAYFDTVYTGGGGFTPGERP